MKRNLKTVSDMAATGPLSESSLRWLIFNAHANGLKQAGAIVRIGRRVFIDADCFDNWIDSQNGLPTAPKATGAARANLTPDPEAEAASERQAAFARLCELAGGSDEFGELSERETRLMAAAFKFAVRNMGPSMGKKS